MELVKPGVVIDFMRYRRQFGALSVFLAAAGLVSVFVPGPNYGIDFKGGTEIEVEFKKKVDSGTLRAAIVSLGYKRPDVVRVEGTDNRYILRVLEVSSLSSGQADKMEKALAKRLGEVKVDQFKVSPGGDKVSLRLSAEADPKLIREALGEAGARVSEVLPFGRKGDNRYEARLEGVADELMRGLKQKLPDRTPDTALRVEWVGPKAGAKLRDSAIKSLLYAITFIMVYVALRFDLRFAPGGIVALTHDVFITIGIFVLFRKEVNLSTVAALLTVVGYSVNDTIVVYDRIRENLQRMRDASFIQIINTSTSQTLSRSIVTSLTTLLAICAFFLWGTPIIRDIALALSIGISIGTYSSIYIAAPFTEWMDRLVFRKL